MLKTRRLRERGLRVAPFEGSFKSWAWNGLYYLLKPSSHQCNYCRCLQQNNRHFQRCWTWMRVALDKVGKPRNSNLRHLKARNEELQMYSNNCYLLLSSNKSCSSDCASADSPTSWRSWTDRLFLCGIASILEEFCGQRTVNNSHFWLSSLNLPVVRVAGDLWNFDVPKPVESSVKSECQRRRVAVDDSRIQIHYETQPLRQGRP